MSFRERYNAADQDPEAMGEVGEVLCAAMVAWGAKYSGNPIVLGLLGGESESCDWLSLATWPEVVFHPQLLSISKSSRYAHTTSDPLIKINPLIIPDLSEPLDSRWS
jgi:hypothetical protein